MSISLFTHILKEYVTESRYEGYKVSITDFFIYLREMRDLAYYDVYVEYYYEGEHHFFNSYFKAKRYYNKMCKCDNTLVQLDGPGVHLTNGKEYLRG